MCSFSYDALVRTVSRLRAEAPFLHVGVFGRSTCGRGLFALRFGDAPGGALVLAMLDAAQQTAGQALLDWAENMSACLNADVPLCGVDLSRVFRQSSLTLVPCMNPDGLEICRDGARGAGSLGRFVRRLSDTDEPWHANAAGVELTRQFPYRFEFLQQTQALSETQQPAAAGFFGTAPLTEPEARALMQLCRRERFSRALLLEVGTPLLQVFPAGESAADRETVLSAKMLSASALVPFVLPSPQESAGAFAPWFAQTQQKNAFTFFAEADSAVYARRLEELLVLFAVM